MVNSLRDVVVGVERVTGMMFIRKPAYNEQALMLGTVVAESCIGNRFLRVQLGGGPARGIVQMEIGTAIDIFSNYLRYKRELYGVIMGIVGVTNKKFVLPSASVVDYWLRTNDDFALAMARVHYLRVPAAIPATLLGIAQYYKTHYNTEKGRATVKGFVEKYNKYKCNDVLMDCGYQGVS